MANNLTFIGMCKNGKKVFDRSYRQWHKNLEITVLKEALSQLSPNKKFEAKTVDMKRIIGKNACVKITEDDEIVYVIRKGKNGPSPMVKNKEMIDSSLITILLKKLSKENYLLISAYIGELSEPEPWDSHFYYQFTFKPMDNRDEEWYQKSILFWKTHAFVYNESDIELHLSV